MSHTTHDLVFKWNLTDPLVTNPDIELPQLDIAKNTTEDCTLEYSTGIATLNRIVLIVMEILFTGTIHLQEISHVWPSFLI